MVDLINKAERKLLKGKYWHSADTYLSSIVLDETIIESAETYHVDVETCGQFADGALFVDYSFNPEMKKNARLIKKINTVGFKKMLLENFKDLQNETIEN